MNKYDLDGGKMNVVKTASAGVVNHATFFHFEQTGLKMTERFIWVSREGTGENIVEELTGGDA